LYWLLRVGKVSKRKPVIISEGFKEDERVTRPDYDAAERAGTS
jgi:hypothetical protein